MEDKKGILYKGVCLCGNIVFEFFRGIQENIFANKAILLFISKNSTTPETIRVRLGTFESDIKEHSVTHIFVGSKANVDNITDGLPQNRSNKPNS